MNGYVTPQKKPRPIPNVTPVSRNCFGEETFLATRGHVDQTLGAQVSPSANGVVYRNSYTHVAGLGVIMTTEFVVTFVDPVGQTYGQVKINDRLVGVDGLTLVEADIKTRDDFVAYMRAGNGEAALHSSVKVPCRC